MVVHVVTGGQYGFHRDELAVLDDARQLAWGYVAYPPVTPFFARISLALFGTSLAGFRLFAALAEAAAVVLTGLMARSLGGCRKAQLLAATAAIPFCLVGGAMMQYVSFDYLSWVLAAYFAVRLLQSEDPRWWLAIGCSVGFGLMSKYSMAFFAVCIILALLTTGARRFLKTRWFWLGIAVAFLIFLPNLIWQAQHGFISLEFLRHIHARDVRIGRTKNFLPDQLKFTLFGFALVVAGLYFYLFSQPGRRFRPIAWMYLLPLVIFVVARGRGYYLAGAYPMLYAAGAIWLERWSEQDTKRWKSMLMGALWTALFADIVLVSAIALPISPVNSRLWQFASHINGDLREEIGWPELVRSIAKVRDALPASGREGLGVMAANYGEAGAIDLYGPQYGLPRAISGINSYWYRGYGDPPPQTLIVVGFSSQFLAKTFEQCELAARTENRFGVHNEESEHPEIYVCRGLRQSWPEFWKDFRYYG